jgi:RNA polymerase-binding transcription factor DksA
MDTEAVRASMEAELTELLSRHERISAHLRNADREVPIDWTEMAQFMENDEVLEALEVRTRDRVNALTAALIRVDAGTYGHCTRCDRMIPKERLDLLPATAICDYCAGAEEA